MNSWANYHSHTNFCDGAESPEKYVEEAVRLGMAAYGFSAHAPVPFQTNWCLPDNKFAAYLNEISRIKGKYASDIEVYLGLEIDFIPGIAGRNKHLNALANLDYFIGSVHFIDSFANGEPWNIDTSADLFRKGLEEIFNNDFKRAAIRFWELTRQMVEENNPTIIGHLDKIKMYNPVFNFFHETEKWYRDQVELTLSVIKKHNSIVEINTRGYYRYNQPDLYPGEWITSLIIRKEIPVLISSDAHSPKEITEGMAYAAMKLKQLGVKKLKAMNRLTWIDVSFSEQGLEWPF
jgi:histidinol-phosphatase (PHP family)